MKQSEMQIESLSNQKLIHLYPKYKQSFRKCQFTESIDKHQSKITLHLHKSTNKNVLLKAAHNKIDSFYLLKHCKMLL
jgi:hypothetical protein